MFAHIQAVPAAYSIMADSQEVLLVQYWESFSGKEIRFKNDDEYAEQFRELFARAIQDRLRTTKDSVGILMSGGLDSGSVASMIQKGLIHESGTPKLKAISIIYDNFPIADERDYIHALEQELQLDIEYIQGDQFWFLRDHEAFTPFLELPEMGKEELTLFIFQKFHDNQIQVVLNGHGGDHLMTGSPMKYTDQLKRGDLSVLREMYSHSRIWDKPILPMVYRFLLRPFAPEWLVSSYRKIHGKYQKQQFPSWLRGDFVERTNLKDQSLSPITMDKQIERSRIDAVKQIKTIPFFTRHLEKSVSKSRLDARHPYIDRRLVEYVLSIPQDQHYRAGWWKHLLRNSMNGILPESIRNSDGESNSGTIFSLQLTGKGEPTGARPVQGPNIG